MLTQKTIDIIKLIAPILVETGETLTAHFYDRMFKHNPELQNIFNMTHQKTGRQRAALFNAVGAYALNIDNLAVLGPTVERIAQKHTSFDIQPEQYAIVGHHLTETLRELLGSEFTEDIEIAWIEAYDFLAQIFIDREEEIYTENAAKLGGWRGPRKFVISRIQRESELVKSYILIPEDGNEVMDYPAGQYLGIRVSIPDHPYQAMRQYSLSNAYTNGEYRISVKREGTDLPGLVSNYLHDQAKEGQIVELMAPAGDFFYQSGTAPTVLISAGVGITPMMSILETRAKSHQLASTYFIHACATKAQQSFQQRLNQLSRQGAHTFIWYENDTETELSGRLDLAKIADQLPISEAQYYLCGPVGFMVYAYQQLLSLGVEKEQINYELFGPHHSIEEYLANQ